MSIEYQNKTDVVKLVENKPLKVDESCRDTEVHVFKQCCQNVTLKRLQGKG